MGRKVLYLHPRQNEIACIVRNQVKVLLPNLGSPSAEHVPQLTVGLYPIPCATKFVGQLAATVVQVVPDELDNKIDIALVNFDSLVRELLSHEGEDTIAASGRQEDIAFLLKPVNYYK